MSTILDKIAARKRIRVAERLQKCSRESLKEQALNTPLLRTSFAEAIGGTGQVKLIGEIKKASPSKGIIQPDFFPADQARAYAQAGAAAISVLTEEDYFLGKDEYLVEVRKAVDLPVLRKDFVIDVSQIYEARLLGAAAILLIAAMLDDPTLSRFMAEAEETHLDVLLEVHTEAELERALKAGAKIIGINNRDLNTFEVRLETTERLAKLVPAGQIMVAESGIHSTGDMRRVKWAGVQAVLIGESLMRAAGSKGSVQDKVRELMGRIN
ncbi:indole-3-glycerol phosphate synthase TrpC [Desulfitobacterium sp.]|uniref:indole-3-glycerol phosphate synthase TrpC n=1 Tax=Desulfitobacterium sp. TaxID=49981 RepID=UPI002B204AC9|nr:indole-3-glycerol phosphate synthase TrpC [Desulfitobacterium sp.]MEA4902609.1 indole-3-glycerol phosphate synthase TrpC [Desulfitobacterium sp.]